MKIKLTFLLLLMSALAKAQIVNIPDPNFKAALLSASSTNHIASIAIPDEIFSVSSFNEIDTNNDGEIQISEAQAIKYLNMYNFNISDVTGLEAFSNLIWLSMSNNSHITTLNISGFQDLQSLTCRYNALTSLSLSALPNLLRLDCGNNQLPNLDLSGVTTLTELNCSSNQLLDLNVSTLTNLNALNCSLNQFTHLEISNMANLKRLFCSNNLLSSLNISGLINLNSLDCSYNHLTDVDFSDMINLEVLNCSQNRFPSINLEGLTNLTSLNCSYNFLSNQDFSVASSLTWLDCSNNQFTQLNITGLANLWYLRCASNQILSLSLSGLTRLAELDFFNNHVSNVDISNLHNLRKLSCSNNQLTELDISAFINLQFLYCAYNELTSLSISGFQNLLAVNCSHNLLSTLSVSNLRNIQVLNCSYNQLHDLDVTGVRSLTSLNCSNNQLSILKIKNGNGCWCSGWLNGGDLDFSSNTELQYICCDNEDVATVQSKIEQYGLTNCHVNSYCSFTPGGTYYTINGTNRYDENNNGCDASDIAFPNLRINISNGTTNGGLIADTSGNYFYDVQSGNYSLTPQLENPSYFNVSPATAVTANFPTQASPFVQNYCIAPNGIHHDLEVVVIPLTVARPGFDVRYKIKYKNKGNQTETATLTLGFDDAVMDFVGASSLPTAQNTGSLNWSIGSITPFQSGEITVTFNLNSPIETPPLNGGSHLNFAAAISGLSADETPFDNIFNLPQTVVNSFDPNDKTCLEGSTIDPSMVGQYVHYMIRFENTGTFAAENIVVADIIDTAKFDVSSLQMVSSSHTCYTRINNDKVEFIFENINLPFDDANNDGWVVFKIKTLPTLAVNSTISNTANIYFDYNAPIVTNTATSTITTLATNDFGSNMLLSVFPNPVKETLNIRMKENLILSSVSIYNTLGQLVYVKTNPESAIDVSQLTSGSYIIRCQSEYGMESVKFVKE